MLKTGGNAVDCFMAIIWRVAGAIARFAGAAGARSAAGIRCATYWWSPMEQQEQEPQRKPGTFLPGHDPRRAPPERRRGTHSKIAVAIKKGIFKGAVVHGRDGKGTGGLNGYFEFLAAKHPKVFAGLLGRLLPVHLKTDDALEVNNRFVVNITGVPTGTMFDKADIETMALDDLPPLLEHEPTPPLKVIDGGDDEPPPAA